MRPPRQLGERVRVRSAVLRLGQPRLVLRWDTVPAARHRADHQRARVDAGPAGQLAADDLFHHLDRGRVQFGDAQSRRRQRCDVPARGSRPALPHAHSMRRRTRAAYPGNVGNPPSRRALSAGIPTWSDASYRRSQALTAEDIMTQSVHLSTAGTGVEYIAPDATVTVKVGAEHTNGQFELFEIDAPRGEAAPPHSESWTKAFYVLQGRILVQAGDQGYDLGPGSSISIPAGTLNTFSVLTPSAKFLTISQTGRMSAF